MLNTSMFAALRLTRAINNLPYQPMRIARMGLFEESGVNLRDIAIEEEDGVLQLLTAQPVGAPGTTVHGTDRRVRTFRVPHIPERATVRAEEVQGVRAFGSENTLETARARVNERLAIMRRNIDYTIESHRLSAIMGTLYNANGGTTDLFTEFGVSQQTTAMALGTSTTKLHEKTLDITNKIESALDGVPYTGVSVICGTTFWQDLIEHKAAMETYLYAASQMDKAELRGDARQSFTFGGMEWMRYRGTAAVKVPDAEAYAIPTGVNGMFLTRFAPADYVETVNTNGIPYYVKSEAMNFDKGWELEAQSNPLNLCTRPAAVIKLTAT